MNLRRQRTSEGNSKVNLWESKDFNEETRRNKTRSMGSSNIKRIMKI